jgi:hypothetical protein
MSWLRFLPVPLMLAAALVLVGAYALPFSPAAQSDGAPPLDASAPDPAAGRVLDQAIDRLAPERVGWLENQIWQRTDVQGLAYEAEGRYLAGPGHRLHLHLKTRLGGGEGELRVVCDGRTLCEYRRVGPALGWATERRLDFQQVLREVRAMPRAADVEAEFLQGQSFGGAPALLRSVRQRLTWVRSETVRRDGREFLKLSGVWKEPPGGAWPDGLPRSCRLYLDTQTLWPHRVEWWGRNPPHDGEVLLMQTEYRNPVLNRAPPAEQWEREFTHPVNPDITPDMTGVVVAQLQQRAQQLAAGGK